MPGSAAPPWVARHIAVPVYLVSAALIVVPLADVMTSLFPWRLLEARWRFGAVGMTSNALLIPTLGLVLAFATAALLEHAIVRRTIGIVGLVAGTIGVLTIGVFFLDALQTRDGVPRELLVSFNVAAVTASLKTLLAASIMIALGVAARRAGRETTAPGVPLLPVHPAPAEAAAKSGKA